jgi:hypothetical protein
MYSETKSIEKIRVVYEKSTWSVSSSGDFVVVVIVNNDKACRAM